MSATTPVFSFTEPTVGGDNGVWGGFLNTDWVNLDTYLAVLRQAAKAVTVGATTTLDFTAPASVFTFTVSQATTITFANVPANVTAQQLSTMFVAIITNGGAFTLTWPGSVTWVGNGLPPFQLAGVDIVVGWTPNNGTNWYLAILPNVAPKAAFKNGGLSTSSGSEVSVTSYTLPASSLLATGSAVRITARGRVTGVNATGSVRVKFGATYVDPNIVLNSGAGGSLTFSFEAVVGRTGATTQLATSTLLSQASIAASGTANMVSAAPAETLGNAILIDIRGKSSSTLFVDGVLIEVLG